jgi:anaerobic selenocysteine-containing dehydrogenase
MKACLPERLFTADKTIRLAPEEFVAGLGKLCENTQATTASSDFDLKLIGRRDPRSNNSWLHNSQRLVKGKNRCLALVHPADASSRQLDDGDLAVISSRVGSISIPISISEEMMPGTISIPHGWGHDAQGIKLNIAAKHAGVNTNLLTDEHLLDSVSGNAALNGVPVSLARSSGE